MKALTSAVILSVVTVLIPPSALAASTEATRQALAAAVSQAVQTFEVASGEKSLTHPFYGRGSDMGFAVDGDFGKGLVLTRGQTYVFDVKTNIRHDFYFSSNPRGKGAGTLTDGIIGQFTYNSKVAFTPGPATPDRLYYACRNHEYMGGVIRIADKGETVVLESNPQPAAGPAAVQKTAVPESEIRQKIAFAKLMLEGQPAARVEARGDAEARTLLAQAGSGIAAAEGQLAAGDGQQALALVELALDNARAAIEAVPEEVVATDQRALYQELLEDFRGYKATYTQRYRQSEQSGDRLFEGRPSPATIQQMDDGAVELAGRGNYQEANQILTKAKEIVTVALVTVLEGAEVIYDKSFATPFEEYEYELARYRSFEELIPLAMEQMRPTREATHLVNGFVEKGRKIRREANTVATQGDYATAVLGLQEATRQIQRALMVAGVR